MSKPLFEPGRFYEVAGGRGFIAWIYAADQKLTPNGRLRDVGWLSWNEPFLVLRTETVEAYHQKGAVLVMTENTVGYVFEQWLEGEHVRVKRIG